MNNQKFNVEIWGADLLQNIQAKIGMVGNYGLHACKMCWASNVGLAYILGLDMGVGCCKHYQSI